MRTSLSLIALLTVLSTTSHAQESSSQDRETLAKEAWKAALGVAIDGPKDIPIVDQAILHLKAGQIFVPKAEADQLLISWGNTTDPRLEGIVLPASNDEYWTVLIDRENEGHVSDEEAKSWNADDLLASIREGTEADNADRLARGFPPSEIVGWQQPPTYDSSAHKLVWSLKMQDKGADPAANKQVNYNTYALGRDGFFKLDLLTNEKDFEHDKPIGQMVLASFEYNQGKRYADFDASTDHLAEYGIAALVGGVAAKKLGLLAIMGVFVLKFAKIFAIAAIAGVAVLRRFWPFGKKPKE